MITIEKQQELFTDIAKILSEKIEVYAIGGTAMMFLGLKEQTLDIDLVFLKERDRRLLIDAAKALGYKEMDSKTVYGQKKDIPLMIKLDDSRLDLFSNGVISTKFSEEMVKRVVQTNEFYRNLIIKVVDVHDILVMKCVTLREKDEEDILRIIENKQINWDIITNEAENQIKLGNEKAVLDMGTTFEKLKNKHKAPIPNEVLDKLWNILKKQVDKKAGKKESKSANKAKK